MLYSFARIIMKIGLRFFYRNLHVTGLGNIPDKGPVIIVANHHSSLMDAAMLGILLKRKAYFFARGDVFINPFVRKVLWRLHMLPVHPHAEGRHTLGANDESFLRAQKILAANGLVVFFPESISHTEHRLLDFRKGVFRLAFATLPQLPGGSDIAIVPAGIVYDHPKRCRGDAQIHVGPPRYLSEYRQEWRTSPAAALLHIARDMRAAVKEKMLHVADPLRCHATNYFLELSRPKSALPLRPWHIYSSTKLEKEQAICRIINGMDEPTWKMRSEQLLDYFRALSGNGLNDLAVRTAGSPSLNKDRILWMGYPLYVAGLVCHGLPLLIARRIVEKKVYRPDYYSWIFVACYSLLYCFWLLAWLVVSIVTAGWHGPAIFLLTITAGLFALVWRRRMEYARAIRNWRQLPQAYKDRLIRQRALLV